MEQVKISSAYLPQLLSLQKIFSLLLDHTEAAP